MVLFDEKLNQNITKERVTEITPILEPTTWHEIIDFHEKGRNDSKQALSLITAYAKDKLRTKFTRERKDGNFSSTTCNLLSVFGMGSMVIEIFKAQSRKHYFLENFQLPDEFSSVSYSLLIKIIAAYIHDGNRNIFLRRNPEKLTEQELLTEEDEFLNPALMYVLRIASSAPEAKD